MTGPPSPWAERFAPFEGIAYLDAASQGLMPLAAARAGREALALDERPWRTRGNTWASLQAETRALLARLLGAREESVALVTGADQILNAVARGLELDGEDEILVARHEFPSNDFPWRWIARRGVHLRFVEPDDPTGAVSAGRLAGEIGSRTRVVAFSHVSHLHGGRMDPGPVVEAAQKAGALTVVDGSHAAGALPFDFGASGIDVYAASGHRFLLGPHGSGVGLLSTRALERLATGDVPWWNVAGADDPTHLPSAIEMKPGAVRYDAHEPASLELLMPLAESLRLLLEATPAMVQAHARSLGDRVLSRLPRGFAPASAPGTSARSHILCLRAETAAATRDAYERLRATGVQVTLRDDRLRLSPHLYNSVEDVDRLLAALVDGG